MAKKKKEKNPFYTAKGAWLWLICAPFAFIGSVIWETKKARQQYAEQYDEFDWWQDNQGL